MALSRILQVDIGTPAIFNDDGSVKVSGNALRISGLDVAFSVKRSQKSSDNGAELTIYNATAETRAVILRNGNNVVVRAGYADQTVGVIFIGNITDVRTGKEGGDTVTTVSAVSQCAAEQPLERTGVSLSYAALTSTGTILQALGDILGLVVTGTENIADIYTAGNWAHAGTWRAALRYVERVISAHGFGVYVDNGELIVYRLGGGLSTYTAALLGYDNGLIKVGDITEAFVEGGRDAKGVPIPRPPKRISFESLLNWRMRPNGLVKIDTPDLKGVYLIEKLEFSGDNFGGDFNAKGEATEGEA